MSTTYSFITNAFRYVDGADSVVRQTYPLARQVTLDGRLTSLTDAQTVANALFDVLGEPRYLFEVPVIGIDVVRPSDFIGLVPCATIVSDRFGLQAGRLVAIVQYNLNPATNQTTLRCWG